LFFVWKKTIKTDAGLSQQKSFLKAKKA